MRINFLTIVLLLLFTKTTAQQVVEQDLHSLLLNEVKVLRIYIPEGYEASKSKYPLTVVLDSDVLFDSYVASAQLFAHNEKAPGQIIVGVSQNIEAYKFRDYGYNFINSYPNNTSMNIIQYIKTELVPFLKKNYRIANFKTIVGMELTGNFVNYFMFDKELMFNGYVSINSHYAPDMPDFMKRYAKAIKGDETFYYMGHGNNSHANRQKVIDAVDVGLQGVSNPYFYYKYEAFENASNLVAIPQSLASAQSFLFSMYSSISKEEYEENLAFLSPLAAIEYLLFKYENIEYLYGTKIPIRLEDFIAIESIVMDKEEGKHLKEYGELILEKHPKEALGHYYIGQYYEKKKDYDEALLCYKRGLSKIPESSPKFDGFFMNIKRITTLQRLEKEEANRPREEENYEDETTEN